LSSDLITRRGAALGLLALGGCGFAPVYGTNASATGQFTFETDDTVTGFRLRDQLERRLGVAQAPVYLLRATTRTSEQAAAITEDGDTTRLNIIGTTTWRVLDLASGAQIAGGEVEAFTSYATTGSTIATQTTRDDATARLAAILADMIVSRVLLLPQAAQQ